MLEATKVSTTGHLYFIPRQHMDKVDTLETFIEQLSAMNQNDNSLSVNSFYIIDDAKQRDKMTEEFYSAVKKEIALYQETVSYTHLDVYKRQLRSSVSLTRSLMQSLTAGEASLHITPYFRHTSPKMT